MTGCMRGWHDNPQKGGDIITKVKLDYKDGLSYLIGSYEKTPGHRGQFTAYEDIIIYFPGSKKNGDYRLEIKGANAPLHSDICRILYDYIKSNQYSYTYIITALRHVTWILIWNTYKISYSGLRCRKRLIILVRIPDMQAGTLPTAGTLRPSTVQGKMFPLQSGPCVTDVITTKVRGLIYMYCLTVRPFITIK